MPTSPTLAAGSDIRRQIGLRFAATSSVTFLLGILLNWQNAYLAAVFVTILLEAPRPVPVRAGLTLLVATFGIYLSLFVTFTLLLPYPVLFFAAMVGVLALVANWSASGRPKLLVIMTLFGVLIIPAVARDSVSAAWTQAVWMPLNLAIGIAASWVAFMLSPALPGTSSLQPSERDKGSGQFWRVLLGLAPIAVLVLLLGADHLLTLLYFGLFATQLAAEDNGGAITPWEKLVANVAGIALALLAYELVVISPTFVMLALVTTLACVGCGAWLASGRNDANLARSALTGTLILLGDAMAPISDTVEVSAFDRAFDIAVAVVLAFTTYSVIDQVVPARPQNAREKA